MILDSPNTATRLAEPGRPKRKQHARRHQVGCHRCRGRACARRAGQGQHQRRERRVRKMKGRP